MLSIIICSRTQTISNDLFNNIKNTIGYEYELIIIDNSENKYSIFEAYNLGIGKSKGKYLCFIHDDILFHSQNWGGFVNRIFSENPKAGLLGIAGSKVKTKMPSGWWKCPDEFKEINIIQHHSNKEIEKWEYGFKGTSISEVVAIDGVFMVMRKNCNLFFNTTLKGFHNYDLNISFECKKRGYDIFVSNEILIEHFSNGVINDSWFESASKIHHIYRDLLPLKTADIYDLKFFKELEFQNGKGFLSKFLSLGYKNEVLRIWIYLFILKPNTIYHLRFFKRFLKL